MSNIKKIDPILKNSTHVIISITQQLTVLLRMFPSESDIYTICQTTLVFDKCDLAIREIVRWLCLIFMAKEKYFHLTAMNLKNDSISFNVMRENSYFYDKALAEACQYLVPNIITKNNEIHELLQPLVMCKQNPTFQRFPALAVVLILYILKKLVIADQRLCYHLDTLVQILIYTPPENLIENFYLQLNDLISKINMEEELEDE